jgi:hypothetical protein
VRAGRWCRIEWAPDGGWPRVGQTVRREEGCFSEKKKKTANSFHHFLRSYTAKIALRNTIFWAKSAENSSI